MPIVFRGPVLVASLSVLLAGCSRTASTPDGSAPPVAVDAAVVDASPPRDAGRGDAAALSPSERAKALKDLNEGRKLSRAKNWTAAMAAFERVLAVTPDDVPALSELGWAALQANDLPRAARANRRALANAKTPALRAPVLYNIGRVAEAQGDKDAAAKAYAESLALRDNAEVKKRIASLDAGAPLDAMPAEPCLQSFPAISGLCACLLAHKDDTIMTLTTSELSCKPVAASLVLGSPRLGVLEWGAEFRGEKVHLLTVREGDKVRSIAELGRDYEPGAFGVHNSAEVKGGEKRTVHGHDIFVIRSEQHDNDYNLAGLELCSYSAKRETVCVLGDAPGSTRCVAEIPIESESGCGPGVETDEAELDEETKKEVAEIKKNATLSRTKTAWSVSSDGTLTVTLHEGARNGIDERLFKPHRLW
jgi:hypothetical protein